MSMPKDLYYQLNRAFDVVRTAEKEAARLEQEAEAIRDNARKEVQTLYDTLNSASIQLATSGKNANG